MTFTQLEIFLKVAELKSFTATAEEFGISQSAVSHALKALEKEWHVALFYREQHTITLTSIGDKLVQHAREILNISNHLKQDLVDYHGLEQGVLRIGSFGASSSTVLIPLILEKFTQQYPYIEIYIEEGSDKDIADWLTERKIDVGFVVLPEDRFDTFELMEDIFVALVSNQCPLANEKAIEITQLAQYPFLMTAAGSQNHVKEIFKLYDVKPHIQGHFSQLLTIINMVNNHVGVSIVADMAVNKHLLALYPHVIKRPLSPNLKRMIGLSVKNKDYLSPATQAFIEIAIALFKTN